MKKSQQQQHSAIILAAGYSKRMGSPKFSLRFHNGKTFLETIIEKYLDLGCKETMIVANPGNISQIEKIITAYAGKVFVTLNPMQESEKLQSVIIGCRALSGCPAAFIHPVDNPFVLRKTLSVILNEIQDFDYAFPCFDEKGGHPVLITSKISEVLKAKSSVNETLRDFLRAFNGKKVEVIDKMVLANINTPHDYDQIFTEYAANRGKFQ